MFRSLLATLCASVFSVLLISGARGFDEDYHMGEWIGTWSSADTSGSFDLDLQRASDGNVAGNVIVATDNQKAEYDVDLRNISFDGDNFTATFITPGKPQNIIKLTGSLSAQTGSGQWVARKRMQTSTQTPESGTWQLQKHST